MRKRNKLRIEIEKIELQYQVKLWLKFNHKYGKQVWETEYNGTTVYADTLENMEAALKQLKDSEV